MFAGDLCTSTAMFGTLLIDAAIIDGAALVAGVGQPIDKAFDRPASLAGSRVKGAVLRTAGAAGGGLYKVVLPVPPFTFFRIRFFCIDKVLDGAQQV